MKYIVKEYSKGTEKELFEGTEKEVGGYLIENAYDRYTVNLYYEEDTEQMKEFLADYSDDFMDTEEMIQKSMDDGMSWDEALKHAYKKQVGSLLTYIKDSIEECEQKGFDRLGIRLGTYGFYGLEIVRR